MDGAPNSRSLSCKYSEKMRKNYLAGLPMDNAQALAFLENLMVQYTREDHLIAVGRKVFMRHVGDINRSFAHDIGRALTLERHLRNAPNVILYQKHEVGSLIRFESGAVGSADGMALLDYLLKVPTLMTLNNAQVNELEFLLNKAGKSLGVELPTVRAATDEEQVAALTELGLPLMVIYAKPRPAYEKFREILKRRGTPVTMTPKEFVAFLRSLM